MEVTFRLTTDFAYALNMHVKQQNKRTKKRIGFRCTYFNGVNNERNGIIHIHEHHTLKYSKQLVQPLYTTFRQHLPSQQQ